MIVYFTGTGNSKYVAKKLAKITKEETLNANRAVRKKESLSIEDDRLIFICPVYVSAPAIPFMDLIRRSSFKKGAKAYFIVTCGASKGCSPKYFRDLSEEKGIEYMGCEQVVMPQNYIVYFKMSDDQENKKIIKDADPSVKKIAESILKNEPFAETPMKTSEYVMTKMILGAYYKFFMTSKCFVATDKCVGCGKCEQDCPLGNVSIDNGHPVWGQECVHCMACINRCPKEAIEGGKKTVGKVRYHGPEVLLADL